MGPCLERAGEGALRLGVPLELEQGVAEPEQASSIAGLGHGSPPEGQHCLLQQAPVAVYMQTFMTLSTIQFTPNMSCCRIQPKEYALVSCTFVTSQRKVREALTGRFLAEHSKTLQVS